MLTHAHDDHIILNVLLIMTTCILSFRRVWRCVNFTNLRGFTKHSYKGIQLIERRLRKTRILNTGKINVISIEATRRDCRFIGPNLIFYELSVRENNTNDSVVTQRPLKIGFQSMTCWCVHLAGHILSCLTFIDYLYFFV